MARRLTYIPNRVIDTNGISDGASIYVYQTGTTTLVSLYSDESLTTPIANPYVVPAGAAVPEIYHDHSGNIRVRVVQSGGGVVSDDDPYQAPVTDIDLASTDTGKGAALVAYKAPYTDTVSRTIGGKFPDVVGVTDFGAPISDATTAFTKAFAAAAEYGRDLYIPKLDAGAKYSLAGDLLVPEAMRICGGGSGSGTDREPPGSLLEFTDGSLLCQDAGGLTLENLRVSRVGTVGPALDFAATTVGTARNVLNNVSVVGSPGIGARFSGGWLLSWFNPYVRQCADIGILVEEGSFVTGMNSMSLFGGEIQSCTNAGIVLDRCKQFNLVGTAVEGNGIGLGLGKSVESVNILGYFEANYNGNIIPYSHNGGSAGVAQCVVVQGGSYFLRGSSGPDTTIDIPLCRQFHMEPGVRVRGYAAATDPIIHVADVGDSLRAYGSIEGISIDCPPELVLQNDAQFFGKETRRHFYLNATTSDTATSLYKVPVWKGPSERRNPSAKAVVILHLNVTTGGVAVFSCGGRTSAGGTASTQVNNSATVIAGYNRVTMTIDDSEDIAYIDVWRSGASGSDTAVGVVITSVEVLTYENSVKVVV